FNLGKHHQLAIGARRVLWFDLPIWQGLHQKQYVLNRLKATTDLIAIAHPAALRGYSYPDDQLRQLTGYQLLEVVNGRFESESSWDGALSAGRPVWAIGNDHTHDVMDRNHFAVAWTMIDTATDTASSVIEALRAGRAYVVESLSESQGPDVALSQVTLGNGVV